MAEKLKIKRFSKNQGMLLLETPDKDTWFFLADKVQGYCKANNISDGDTVEIQYEKSPKKGESSTITFLKSDNAKSGVENKPETKSNYKSTGYNSKDNIEGMKRGCALNGACNAVAGLSLETEEQLKSAIKDIFEYNLGLLQG